MRLFLTIVFLTLCLGLHAESVEEKLKNLTLKERSYLKFFFNDLIYYDSFGHVLFYQNKPVCLIGLIKKGYGSFREKLPYKGWEVWKNVEYLFPHPNFIFCEEVINLNSSIVSVISIVNKKTTLNVVKKHENLFKEVLGQDFSPSNFIAQIENKKQLRALINDDEALLGILLGFGEESAKAFKEKEINGSRSSHSSDYQCIEIKGPEKCRIYPIGFLGNPTSEEVKQLKDIYSYELKNLWALYRGKNSLKITLEKLCQE